MTGLDGGSMKNHILIIMVCLLALFLGNCIPAFLVVWAGSLLVPYTLHVYAVALFGLTITVLEIVWGMAEWKNHGSE